ncbi:gamma-tubulin complex component 5-like [Daphnia carinata]|uniref:gamma-tubulin complex component 5-like n=1 Tax=Daphnia carinata TaxID=120202 RepID=UPI00257FBD23|nr:gamma-tubulin complex component 5-like [Daphnia carinata]
MTYMDRNCEIRTACKKLLKLITNKETSEESKSVSEIICQLKQDCNYTTEQDVKRSIEGIQHKLDIHAEHKKSRHFKQLVTKYIQLTVPKGLTHPTWSILYLLIRLAYRPTEHIYLTPDGCILQNLNSETEKYSNKQFQHGKTQLVSNKDVTQSMPETVAVSCYSITSESEEENMQVTNTHEIFHQKLCVTASIIPTFSKQKQCSIKNLSLNGLFKKTHDKDSTSKIWIEYYVLHEVLWTLHKSCGNEKTTMNSTENGNENKVLTVAGLPSFSVNCFYPLVKAMKEINFFLTNTAPQEHTLTYQAYTVALSGVIAEFNQSVAEYEKGVAQQKATSTISQLLLRLKSWTFNIRAIAAMHTTIMQMSSSMADNNTRITHLLSTVYDSAQKAQVTSYSTLYPVLLKILFASLEPFFNMVDLWLDQGVIVDPYQEFGILRNEAVSPQDERFWSEVFVSRTTQPLISFLKPLMDDILLGGRSVELLTQLKRKSMHVSDDCRSGTLIQTFRNRFSRFASDDFECGKVFHSSNGTVTTKKYPKQEVRNPLLTKAFETLRNHSSQSQHSKVERSKVDGVSVPLEFYPLLPLLERSLLEPLRSRQRLVCRALLDTLYEDCCLKLHILTIRRVHLMQAGDLMGRFCLQLFQKLETGEKWDNESSLTLSLLNCISSRMGQCGSYLSVTIKRGSIQHTPANLADVQINYKVPWPVNLVITQDSISLYNSVLRFLMQIKQGMFSLQHLSFKDLNCMDVANVSHQRQQELSSATRRHRLQLLRAWLLHFVSSVDNYIMECVLESSHIRLDMQLENAAHLGQIIDSHHEYVTSIHKQCLQQPSGAFLRDAINEVLSISREVVIAWKNGLELEKLNQLEENYVRHHQFVAAVLGSDSAHSMLPHVETLAAALIHSCPATR